MQISTGEAVPSKKKLFSVEDMGLIQQDLSLSNRQVKILGEDMRKASGSRNLIETSMSEKIIVKNRCLQDMFEDKICPFLTVNETTQTKMNFEQHVVICNDLNGLVDKIIKERNIDKTNMLIRIVLDGGGGFMKICLSIFDLNENGQNGDQTGEGKRLKERFKNSGVKNIMIIGVVPDIQENYVNVKRLWLECGIDKLSRQYTIATDLK